MALSENSSDAKVPAVEGTNSASGVGILGVGKVGLVGASSPPTTDFSKQFFSSGVQGFGAIGVSGEGAVAGVTGTGVDNGVGVNGASTNGQGVRGESQNGEGVHGESRSTAHAGVSGINTGQGFGMLAQGKQGSGLVATSERGQGISAFSDNDIAVFAQGATFSGVFNGAFVVNKGPNPKDTSIKPSDINGSIVINEGNLFLNSGDIFHHKGTARFQGDVEVAGDVRLVNQDLAEEFDIRDQCDVEPGSVMVFDLEGVLLPCCAPYDRRVAGVIAGAGACKPAIVLGKLAGRRGRLPIALVGKAFCKVDAEYGPIEVGDLLTTSGTTAHAMKATDHTKAFGAVLGKALRSLGSGRGLIPMLIALQ
jgi:hypothetical protein